MSQVVQDEKRERFTRIIAAASLAMSCLYIVWRWGWTLDTENLWFSVPLVLAETYGVLSAALLTYTAWRLHHRESLPPLADRTVDVFVTTATEPIAVIRKTVLAAREISYPHTTWLLDDGHRDEVRAVAEEIGIRYLRRDDRLNGKAGNLDHALAHSTGEFIVQLDADHVVLPQIIDRLIGFFADERVAFAQSPQDFYNTDTFSDDASGRGRLLWGDQQLITHVLQPGKDRVNAAIFMGSCAMLRRTAVQDVGGFAVHSPDVGAETSLLLHARGWRSAYLNENLAFGLAPTTAHAYQEQQLHRTQGAMQALRRHSPLAVPGLSAGQRIGYFDTLTTPVGGVQRLIIYLAPIVFLTTGVFPIRASVGLFALLFLPAVLLRAASFRLLTRGQGSLLLIDRYWMAKFFTHVLSVRAYLTPKRLRYRARPDQAGAVPLRTVAPQLTLIAVTAIALGWAVYARAIGYGTAVPGWGSLALYGAVLLALWHALLAGHVVQLSLAGRHRRAEHRFAEALSVTVRVLREDGKLSSSDIAMTEDLTAGGVALRAMYPFPEGARVELALPLNSGEVNVRGRVVRRSTDDTTLGTVHLAGVEFDSLSTGTRDAIELHCAQHAMPIQQERQRQSALGAGAARRWRDLRGERRVGAGMPAHVTSDSGGEPLQLGVGLLEDVSPRGGRILLEQPVSLGSALTLHIPGAPEPVMGRVAFVHAIETSLGIRFVAGFSTAALEPAVPGVPAAPTWFTTVTQLAGKYGRTAGERARVAADVVARGSRAAAAGAVATSQTAAEKASAASRAAAERAGAVTRGASERALVATKNTGGQLSLVSRNTAAKLSQESRVIVDKIADGSRVAARIVAARSAAAMAATKRSAPASPQRFSGEHRVIAEEQGIAPELVVVAQQPASAPEPAPEPVAAVVVAVEVAVEQVISAQPVSVAAGEEPARIIEMEIDGEFSFPFELSVGATFLITESGRVTADIAAVHAIVLGSYSGTLRASRSISVGPRGVVQGTLEAPEIQVADGAVINGVAIPPAPVDDLPALESSVPHGDEASASGPEVASTTVGETQSPAGTNDTLPPPEDEIFVVSPIFAEGVSRE